MTFGLLKRRVRIEVQHHYRTISQAEALQKLHRMREYQQLRRLIGGHIDEVVLSYDCYVQQSTGHGIYHPTSPGLRINLSEHYGAESELDMYRTMLVRERQTFLTVRTQISELWRLANDGRLHPRLQLEHRAPEDYGATATDDDMERAIKWAYSPYQDNPDVARANIMRQVFDYVINNMDVREMATADYLHTNLVDPNTIPAHRRHHANTGYCSTGGGRALQDGMEVLSQGFAVAQNSGATEWDDLACFLFGSHVRAQAYSDGNKRLSRALYAITLLKGGRPFLAPGDTLEPTLMGQHFMA